MQLSLFAFLTIALGANARNLQSYGGGSSSGKSSSQLVTSAREGSRTVYTVQWMEGKQYSDINAQCGDIVEFQWSGNLHDVVIAVDGDCSQMMDSAPLASPANSGQVRITLDNTLEPIRENGEVYFACSVGRHCERNQVIEFYVDCLDGATNATAPTPAPGQAVAAAPRAALATAG